MNWSRNPVCHVTVTSWHFCNITILTCLKNHLTSSSKPFMHEIYLFIPWPLTCFLSILSHPILDHSAQTVEACVWWTRREPQQHQRRHVHTETLREVSYRSAHSDKTQYCYSCTHGRVSTHTHTRAHTRVRHPCPPACLPALDSSTSASNMTSQWFIHSTGPLQDKYWFLYSEVGIDALGHFFFFLFIAMWCLQKWDSLKITAWFCPQ